MHPIGLDLTCFDALVEVIRDRFQLLRVDLRGHGRSPQAASSMELADYADDVHDTLMALRFAPAAIVGFSFGGMIAQTLALAHPTDVTALVLGACAATLAEEARGTMIGRGEVAAREGMAAVVETTLQRWFTRAFLERGAAEGIRRRLLDDDVHGWSAGWRAIARLDTLSRLHTIDVPTLCLAGELDLSAPPPVVGAVADTIPGARLIVLAGAPHMLFVERPLDVAGAIVSFLDSR